MLISNRMMSGAVSSVGVNGSTPGVTMFAPAKIPSQNLNRLRDKNLALTIPAIPSIVIASGSSKVMPKMTISKRAKLM